MGKLKFRFISEDVALYYETDGTADGTWFLSYNISELSGLVDFFHKNHWLVSWCGLGCNMFLKGNAARDYFNCLVNRDRYQSLSSKGPV